MGRDNQPKDRQKSKQVRREASRDEYPMILFVCEGEKTEPLYLQEFMRDIQYPAKKFQIEGLGTTPDNLVKMAKVRGLKKTEGFNRIYIIFDRDDHTQYEDAIGHAKQIQSKAKNLVFEVIASVPCFELWLLLHFSGINGGSNLDRSQVVKLLKQHISNYEKASPGVYTQIKEKMNEAIKNAGSLRKVGNHQLSGKHSPYTDMDLLITKLQAL